MNNLKPILAFCLCLFSAFAPVIAATDSEVQKITRKIDALDLHHTAMDFARFFETVDDVNIGRKSEDIKQLWEQYHRLDNNTDNHCDRLAMNDAQFKLQIAQERLSLIRQLNQSDEPYKGSFRGLSSGSDWYAHWLRSWLQSDVTLEQLKAIAHRELNDVKQKREALMSLRLPHDEREIAGADSYKIISEFKQRERLVYQRTAEVLGTEFRAEDVHIEESNFPDYFPAPGLYNSFNRTFIYHLHGDTIPVKQMDWLFIHEAVPGHHYFNEYRENAVTCPSYNHSTGSTLFTEGWAAYMETLGTELGLFRDSSSIHYALDWQAMRAVRVLLDIGMHAYGWNDDKAREVWMNHISEQEDIMQREIDRIRKWPVQVITYVYGKAVIQDVVRQAMDSNNAEMAQIHQQVLGLSNFSIGALRHLSAG